MNRTSYDRLYHFILVVSFALASGTVALAAPKVTICHFPPGNPANVKVLSVGAPAVPAHLTQHHDAVCTAGDSNCCFGGSGPSVCTDFQTDPNNCGACGNVCTAGATCTNGTCVSPCAPGTTPCNGVCVDESTDPNNCGACGNVCSGGSTCTGGACTCAPGTTLCNGVCVDESTDPNNCGACGNVCSGGSTCTGGACTCAPGTTLCNGVCVDESTDPNNCGACGNVCSGGSTCTGGACTCAPGTTLCNGVCVDESTDPNNCGACGNVCSGGSTCTGGACTCAPGTTLCNGVCVDESTDPNNCGACGNVCAGGTICTGGACTCAPGTTLCNGVCVDESTDPNNCGACGNVCSGGSTCTGGACTCAPGTTLCNGVCVDESTDPNNCGACGNVCAGGTTCTGGACVISCPGGTTLCGAVCVNQSTDPNNCGACGNVCAGGTTCTGGACQSICPPGSALCSGMCVNQNTDPNNCGSCGTVCGSGTTCTGGTCVTTDVAGSCLPTSSLGVLIRGSAPMATVTAYVPLGSWSEFTSGIIVVQLEPTVGAPTVVPTTDPVNSCSSNGTTGLTVCSGNSNDVYVLSGTTLLTTLTADATGSQNFSGGSCMTCGVATDASTGLAWLAEGTITSSGQLQSLNPLTSVFGAPLDLFGEMTSEDISIDPVRHLILSALENGNFQIIDTLTNSVFNSTTSFAPLELDSTAEDCTTGIAVAPGEFSSSIVLADLSQASYTPGTPGTWSAPAMAQDFPDFSSFLAAGISGIAVAPGSHLAGVTDEFGGPAFGVVQLPATSGAGTPSAVDYVAAMMPNDPAGAPWDMGLDPHTMTAYSSPNTGTAILAISNLARTYLALVDMQALLGAPRTPGTHTVDPGVDLVSSGIVTFVAE